MASFDPNNLYFKLSLLSLKVIPSTDIISAQKRCNKITIGNNRNVKFYHPQHSLCDMILYMYLCSDKNKKKKKTTRTKNTYSHGSV